VSKVIEFDDSSKKYLLKLLDKDVDSEGYIIEKNTKERVLTPQGEYIKLDEFAAYKKGSEIFIKSDITSLIDLIED